MFRKISSWLGGWENFSKKLKMKTLNEKLNFKKMYASINNNTRCKHNLGDNFHKY